MPKISSMGLGKPTLRGLRRCQKCGTINGTRGFACKNKACNAVFKEYNGKRKCWSDACRLETGTTTRVYSVRVRDKGPECRGFVQLPAVPANLEKPTDVDGTALCFVDNCEGNFNTKVLQCHESKASKQSPICNHISAAAHCAANAQPLSLNTAVLDALSIEPQIKEEVWQLFSEGMGPTVQRVSRSVMAVKCRATPKSPLGYLHVSFTFGRTDQDVQFTCPCLTLKDNVRLRHFDNRCPHFYACICAFINQDNLRDEFYSFIRLEVALDLPTSKAETSPQGNRCDPEGDLTNLFVSNGCHVEVLQDDVCTILSQTITEDVDSILSEDIPGDAVVFSTVESLDVQDVDCNKVNIETDQSLSFPLEDNDIDQSQLTTMDALDLVPSSVSSVDLLTLDLNTRCSPQLDKIQSSFIPTDIEFQEMVPYLLETVIEPKVVPISKKKTGTSRPQLSFLDWLGSVTETINQHMHYQFPGKGISVVFQTPSKFFEKLKERMYKPRRRKVATSVTTFTRRESLPVGTFTKYSWVLVNRMHVKSIFDTPNMPLHLVQSFMRKDDGTYDLADQAATVASASQVQERLFKTYLRVGLHRGETEPAVFKIDWVPNVLPLSHIGELNIEFEYGHVPRQSYTS